MSRSKITPGVVTGALVSLAAAVMVIGVAGSGEPSWEQVATAGMLGAGMTATYLFPMHFGFKTKLHLDTALIFASVLLFEPGVAVVAMALGTALAYLLRGRSPDELLFNTSQVSLQTAAGSAVLMLTGWSRQALRFERPQLLPVLLVVALVMFLVNTLLVATIVALQSGQSPLYVWYHSTTGFDRVEKLSHLSQLGLGLLAAVVADAHLWALPLLAVPALALYRSLERHIRLREQTMEAVVESLADMVDVRDPYTTNHSKRVAEYARLLGEKLELLPDEIELIERAARVHDIGKIVIDIEILSKQSRLSEYEWEQLRRHPQTGAEMLERFPQFALAAKYVRHHHERVDGKGYPEGLRGEQIPLGARIIAVADSFDAMTTARPYRTALSLELTLEEFERQKHKQWDARVVDALLSLLDSGAISSPLHSNSNLLPFRAG